MNLLTSWFKRTLADPQVVILGLVLIAGVAIVAGLGTMLTPVFASIVLAYLLEAVVVRLQLLGLPRLASVLLVCYAETLSSGNTYLMRRRYLKRTKNPAQNGCVFI